MSRVDNVKKVSERLDLAQELSELWSLNEDSMGEMAAFCVACNQLGIDEDEGWELMASLNSSMRKE